MATAHLDFALKPSTCFSAELPSNPSKFRVFTIRCSAPRFSAATATGLVERPWNVSNARLVLEDESIWRAKSFGASGTLVGEVVFNTSLMGYQEILTDPSYAGQFVLMTNPHWQYWHKFCLVIRSSSINTSNWRCTKELPKYLAERNIMGIYDVDTRAITRRLRQDGSLIGVLSTEESKTDEELLKMSRSWDIVGIDLISSVSCKEPYEWVDKTKSDWEFNTDGGKLPSYCI
ncbi:hypothetical protein ACOSQ4_013896 [Xanthoceras sorbifolium]